MSATHLAKDTKEEINFYEIDNIDELLDEIEADEKKEEERRASRMFAPNEIKIFKTNAEVATCKSIEDGCVSTERMLCVLKYYSLFSEDKETIIKFVNETYKLFLEDYIHIIDKHNNHLENIHKIMVEKYNPNVCNIRTCPLIYRHNRNRNNDKNIAAFDNVSDENTLFYVDLLDTIHTYFVHLKDIGMRVKINEIKIDKKDANEGKYQCYDEQFANICKVIKTKQERLEKINGFNNRFEHNNKFNMKPNENNATYTG
eukprot:169649_1